jgi:hypothetical protein
LQPVWLFGFSVLFSACNVSFLLFFHLQLFFVLSEKVEAARKIFKIKPKALRLGA